MFYSCFIFTDVSASCCDPRGELGSVPSGFNGSLAGCSVKGKMFKTNMAEFQLRDIVSFGETEEKLMLKVGYVNETVSAAEVIQVL
jgi:hypothetical protein